MYSESSVIRTSIIRILDYPDHKITLHVTMDYAIIAPTHIYTQYASRNHRLAHIAIIGKWRP